MIVVDSSAIVAILLDEPDRAFYLETILASERSLMSAVNAHETALVLRLKRGAEAVDLLWQFLSGVGIEIVPFDEAQVHAAAAAFDRFGKGLRANARLNLADCAAYALARTMDAPLLFKGMDFSATDVRSCA